MKRHITGALRARLSRRTLAPPKQPKADVGVRWGHGVIDDLGRPVVSGTAPDGVIVEAVLFRVRGTEAIATVPTGGGARFTAAVDLPADLPERYFAVDVYLQTIDRAGTSVRHRLLAGPEERFVALFGFGEAVDRPAWWYATKGGALALRVGVPRRQQARVDVTAVKRVQRGFEFAAEIFTVRADFRHAHLEISVRNSDFLVRAPLTVDAVSREPTSQEATLHVSGTIDVDTLIEAGLPFQEQSVDVAIVADQPGDAQLRRGLAIAEELKDFRRLAPVSRTLDGITQAFVPFVTFKSTNLAFASEIFTASDYRYLTRLRRLGPLWTLIRVFSRVWIVGETPYKAQDSGFHFFRWVRLNHPRRRVYYVISADSPERAVAEEFGNVVTLRSRDHIRRCFLARRFATSHKADFVLATSDRRAVRWMRGNRVFLQHGVLGTKNMTDTYGRVAPVFHTDYFHVSSPRERELIVNDLRYRPAQVRITGLSRFDRLLEPAEEPPRGVLVIPTWRDWLLRPATFHESEFLERWRAFLQSEPLRRAIADGLPVTLILHPNMRFFGEAFETDGVTVLGQGDLDVQTLLRTHAAMVTDYSSVGFDFSFQGRPVFYHQFDRKRFLGRRPSHLDLDSDLPGDVFTDAEQLASAVVASWRDGFRQDPEHARRSGRFLAPATGSYAQQVFDSVRTARSFWVPFWRLRDSLYGRRTYRWFRASAGYQPAMAAMSAVGRLLPRRDLVVFESNLGNAAADSPRAIYDELVGRGADHQTVWITRSTFRPGDVRTRKVEPGTPGFFWMLSRARYWVNNQNFGPVVTPARGTTYVQTWHGTPLKRMQYDAVSTAGRKPGYLDRVAAKTATWSTLLSPSAYATAAFRSAFRYEGPVIESGYPRNDMLVNDAAAQGELTRRRLGLDPGARIVLYAPTFRDDVKRDDRFVWDGALDWSALVEGLSDGTVVLVRRHSVVRGSLRIPPELRDRVVDVSSYPDTQELLCAADVLVTDYSSVMFDYAILDRPIVLFCYDLDHYRDELRGFYFDLVEEAPGPIVRTQEQLHDALARAEQADDGHGPARRRFRERFAPLDDGRAARRVVDEVFGGSTLE